MQLIKLLRMANLYLVCRGNSIRNILFTNPFKFNYEQKSGILAVAFIKNILENK